MLMPARTSKAETLQVHPRLHSDRAQYAQN